MGNMVFGLCDSHFMHVFHLYHSALYDLIKPNKGIGMVCKWTHCGSGSILGVDITLFIKSEK